MNVSAIRPRAMSCRTSAHSSTTGSDSTLAQLLRFAAVGGSANGVYAALFALLIPFGSMVANVIGVLISTALANEMHRRVTFRASGTIGWFTAQWEGGGLALIGLATSTAALAALHLSIDDPSVIVSASVVIAATAVAGLVRFVVLRGLFRTV